MAQKVCATNPTELLLRLTLGLSGLSRDNEPSSSDPAARKAPNEMRTSPTLLGSFIPTTLSREGLATY